VREPDPLGSDDWASLARALGSSIVSTLAPPWGDARAVTRIDLADGRVVAARWLSGRGSEIEAQRLAERADRLREAGIGVAWPMDDIPSTNGAWVVAPWIVGTVGAAVLADAARRRSFARSMGRLATAVAAVDVRDMAVERTWVDPSMLAQRVGGAVSALGRDLGPAIARGLLADAQAVASDWTGAAEWEPGLAHGDFAPVNVIVRPDDELVLLDLGGFRVAPRILDLAWWGWVVRYHHPAAWTDTWEAFLDGAGLPTSPGIDALAVRVARLVLLERAAEATGPDNRIRWIERISATASW
jgi:aminoglycoside phosphotransferase (APT) family kinase protein